MSDRDDTKPRCAGVDRASGFCNIILWKEKNRGLGLSPVPHAGQWNTDHQDMEDRNCLMGSCGLFLSINLKGASI